MPPLLALFLTGLFIIYLLVRDWRAQPTVSSAVWIPCSWMLILGSRSVAMWLDPSYPQSADDLLEGSPTDRMVFLGLIAAGCLVLSRRHIPWRELFRNNVWLSLFFLYCGISILWSDFPLVAFKRWVKGLGDPVMVLILLSDRQPAKAVETLIKRCAYVLIPLSIVFIKYYPELGRAYDEWTGRAYYTGVTTNKNLLGYLLLVFGLYFVCALFGKGTRDRVAGKRMDVAIAVLFLLMIQWLFGMADSKTALMGLIVGSLVALGLRYASVRKHFGTYAVAGILMCVSLQLAFDIAESLVASVGRDTTLTGRTELWASVLRMRVDAWFGAGFESFWLGERLKQLWAEYYFRPNQAHNGYIEIYLNLGWVGVCLFGGVLWASYRTIEKRLMLSRGLGTTKTGDAAFATFGLAYLTAYVAYNMTEGAFKALNFLFVIFLITAIEYPKTHAADKLATSKGVGLRSRGAVAQLGEHKAAQSGEHAAGSLEVRGSSPFSSTIF
jgi:exopolysaccharide production protein ExoQ